MSYHQPLGLALLLVAAVAGGILNGMAGGGSFVAFPALIFSGVLPVNANATNTVALWPASLAAARAYRRELGLRREVLVLGSVSLVGGLVGAVLLLHTPQHLFGAVVPFLMLGATLLFAAGGRIAHMRGERAAPLWVVSVVQFPIAIYGGYFGGGLGIMMLASFGVLGAADYHFANARKNLLATAINGVAVVTFIAAGAVVWLPALVMIVGAVVGGVLSVMVARRIPQPLIRPAVVAIGLVMSVSLLRNAGI
ncbi:MAG TPA: sulfite exporter TauE/SafE family protein [Candidatus Nitrosotalea sp.]|nr:sulfite exporter TauE/SafE family protein [Candidatus Nitrosotalea sp.]